MHSTGHSTGHSKGRSSGRLRDAPGSCFPPSSSQKQHSTASSRGRRDLGSALEEEGLRGSKLAALVEEPAMHIDKFLRDEPDCELVEDVLKQYRAFVLELGALSSDTTQGEHSWRSSIGTRARELAQRKFQKLKAGQPRLHPILQAYREAVNRLERYLRRQVDCSGQFSSDGGFINVGKIVSTGIGMLFGDSSQSDKCKEKTEPPETLEWVSQLSTSS